MDSTTLEYYPKMLYLFKEKPSTIKHSIFQVVVSWQFMKLLQNIIYRIHVQKKCKCNVNCFRESYHDHLLWSRNTTCINLARAAWSGKRVGGGRSLWNCHEMDSTRLGSNKNKTFLWNADENKLFCAQGHTFSLLSKFNAERQKIDNCHYFTDLLGIFIIIHYLNHTK